MRKRKVTIYRVYDSDGNLLSRGSANEIAKEYCTVYQAVWNAGKGITSKYLHQYTIVRESEKEWRMV